MGDNGKDTPFEESEEMLEEEITYTVLDDERRGELDSMIDLHILGIELEVWDEDEEASGEDSPTPKPAACQKIDALAYSSCSS